MNSPDFSRRELMTLSSLAMLSPTLRIFPSEAAKLAGRAAWLSALLALPLILLYIRLISWLMARAAEGEGLQHLFLKLPGKFTGKAFLLLSGLWFSLYAGFVLRSGGDRLAVTVYPAASPRGFSLIMGLLCAYAALGSARTAVRLGRTVRPVLLGVLALLLFFSLLDIQSRNLLPLTQADIIPALKGAVPAADILGLGCAGVLFLEGCTSHRDGCQRSTSTWAVYYSVLLSLLVLAVVGSFGAGLCETLSSPFFVLVRNLVFFRTVERVEALVVALWIFPDFLLVTLMLLSAQSCLRLALGFSGSVSGGRLFDFSDGRYLIWLCSLAAVAAGVFLAPAKQSLALWSGKVIPALNMGFCFLIIPLAALLLRIKERYGSR